MSFTGGERRQNSFAFIVSWGRENYLIDLLIFRRLRVLKKGAVATRRTPHFMLRISEREISLPHEMSFQLLIFNAFFHSFSSYFITVLHFHPANKHHLRTAAMCSSTPLSTSFFALYMCALGTE